MNGVFVDDEDKQFAIHLGTPDVLKFDFQAVLPITDQAIAIRAAKPTVVALDYRLDEMATNLTAGHTFKGSGLAQLLRDEAISDPANDFAIVLISNDYKLETYFAPDRTAHDLFDLVFAKEDVIAHRSRIRQEIVALGNAYTFLRTLEQPYEPMTLLNATESEYPRVQVQEITTAVSDASAPHIVAKFILYNIIKRPGLLLDDADAAALLGIEVSSLDAIVPTLVDSGILYDGIFADGWRRWWPNRLEDWGEAALGSPLLDLTAQERSDALAARFDLTLVAAPSPWTGRCDEYVAFACCCCRRPTELRHSLAVFEAKAPRFATRRRICWDCVQSDRYLEPGRTWLIDEVDASLVADVKTRARTA